MSKNAVLVFGILATLISASALAMGKKASGPQPVNPATAGVHCRTFGSDFSDGTTDFDLQNKSMLELRDSDLRTTFFTVDAGLLTANENGSYTVHVETHATGGFEFDWDTTGFKLILDGANVPLDANATWKGTLHSVRARYSGFDVESDVDAQCSLTAK